MVREVFVVVNSASFTSSGSILVSCYGARSDSEVNDGCWDVRCWISWVVLVVGCYVGKGCCYGCCSYA